ncbi:MAG: hypothetical protein H0W72_01855, partial [Planctomycetes bacterium]|nr:hypothetical protein [Planctomycetota bacterium]
MPADAAFAAVIADSLRFAWVSGGIIDVPAGYSTSWRVLPVALVAELRAGTGVVEIDQDQPRRLRSGDALCIPAGTLHR